MTKIATIILAAGESSRFNGCKALAEFNQLPLLQHAINHSNAIAHGEQWIITGAWHTEICQYLTESQHRSQVVYHKDWRQGIGSSIAFAVEYINNNNSFDAVLILLADQIAINARDLQSLLSPFNGRNICCAFYHGRPGVPAIFPRSAFESLQALTGDHGAKRLLTDDAFDIHQIVMPNAAIDIDTRVELQRWQQQHDDH